VVQAQTTAAVTVTPNTALRDGQTVLVEASGFTGQPVGGWAVGQCAGAVVGSIDVATVNANCIFTTSVPATSPEFTVELVAVKQGLSYTGRLITCGNAPADCVVLVGQLLAAGGAQVATTPITFGPFTPASKDHCKNGGWRDLANDRGQPFRNQGQCVSYVVAPRR
jgi:hypothetical protein